MTTMVSLQQLPFPQETLGTRPRKPPPLSRPLSDISLNRRAIGVTEATPSRECRPLSFPPIGRSCLCWLDGDKNERLLVIYRHRKMLYARRGRTRGPRSPASNSHRFPHRGSNPSASPFQTRHSLRSFSAAIRFSGKSNSLLGSRKKQSIAFQRDTIYDSLFEGSNQCLVGGKAKHTIGFETPESGFGHRKLRTGSTIEYRSQSSKESLESAAGGEPSYVQGKEST